MLHTYMVNKSLKIWKIQVGISSALFELQISHIWRNFFEVTGDFFYGDLKFLNSLRQSFRTTNTFYFSEFEIKIKFMGKKNNNFTRIPLELVPIVTAAQTTRFYAEIRETGESLGILRGKDDFLNLSLWP